MRFSLILLASALPLATLFGCSVQKADLPLPPSALEIVAESDGQWTGVAVSRQGRIFVNYPRWSPGVRISVGELMPDGTIVPYPDERWNAWDESASPREHFVCVQSVHVDADDFLWILDPANPMFTGVVESGPKLLKVDLRTNRVVRRYFFDDPIVRPDSYLNDVRVDVKRSIAYITDSGDGALLVLDLPTGHARRLLDHHPSTHSEEVLLSIGGAPWLRPDGSRPKVHADGLALHPTGEWLYYQALTGRTMHRIATRHLREETRSEAQLGALVQTVGTTGAADGLIFDREGFLYISALEEDAIRRLTPEHEVELVIKDARIAWPDSFAVDADGRLLFTTAQIHLAPDPPHPYRIFRIGPSR